MSDTDDAECFDDVADSLPPHLPDNASAPPPPDDLPNYYRESVDYIE